MQIRVVMEKDKQITFLLSSILFKIFTTLITKCGKLKTTFLFKNIVKKLLFICDILCKLGETSLITKFKKHLQMRSQIVKHNTF